MAAPLIKTGSGKQFADGHRSAYRIINRIIIRQTVCAACTKSGGGGRLINIDTGDTNGIDEVIVTIKHRAVFLNAGSKPTLRNHESKTRSESALPPFRRDIGKDEIPLGFPIRRRPTDFSPAMTNGSA